MELTQEVQRGGRCGVRRHQTISVENAHPHSRVRRSFLPIGIGRRIFKQQSDYVIGGRRQGSSMGILDSSGGADMKEMTGILSVVFALAGCSVNISLPGQPNQSCVYENIVKDSYRVTCRPAS
jgi:hypothetical protein